ncbi:hypothetical protein PAMA_013547 [Pampus argenteus]
MWMFVMMACLLRQNQAAPIPGEHGSLQVTANTLLHHLHHIQASASPDVDPQKTSSSSSSSSSSVSSESSQSSEGPQMLRERQNLENAVEQTDSQESSETHTNSSSLQLNELVLLGEQVRERDGERDTGGDSVANEESRGKNYISHDAIPEMKDSSPLPQALFLTYHHLLSRPPPRAADSLGGATGEVGGVREINAESMEGLTIDLPDHTDYHRYRGNMVWL